MAEPADGGEVGDGVRGGFRFLRRLLVHFEDGIAVEEPVGELRPDELLFDGRLRGIPVHLDDGRDLRLRPAHAEEHGCGGGHVGGILLVVIAAVVVVAVLDDDAVLDEGVHAIAAEEVGIEGGVDMAARLLFPRLRHRIGRVLYIRKALRDVVLGPRDDIRLVEVDFDRPDDGELAVGLGDGIFDEVHPVAELGDLGLAQRREFGRRVSRAVGHGEGSRGSFDVRAALVALAVVIRVDMFGMRGLGGGHVRAALVALAVAVRVGMFGMRGLGSGHIRAALVALAVAVRVDMLGVRRVGRGHLCAALVALAVAVRVGMGRVRRRACRQHERGREHQTADRTQNFPFHAITPKTDLKKYISSPCIVRKKRGFVNGF